MLYSNMYYNYVLKDIFQRSAVSLNNRPVKKDKPNRTFCKKQEFLFRLNEQRVTVF